MNTGTGITGGEVAAEVGIGMIGEEKEIIVVEAGAAAEALIIEKTVGVGLLEALVEVLMGVIAKNAHLYPKVFHQGADHIREAPLHVPMLMNKRVLVYGMVLELVLCTPFYCF